MEENIIVRIWNYRVPNLIGVAIVVLVFILFCSSAQMKVRQERREAIQRSIDRDRTSGKEVLYR